MTSAVLAARAQAERVRVAVGADTIAVCALALFVGALALLTWGTWGDLDSDTGYDLVAAHRIADGDLIYRDFVYYYGPLGPALLGLLALVGGADVSTAVFLGLPIALGIIAATYLLARAVVSPLGAFLAASITAAVAFIPDNYSYVLPHTTDMTLGMLLLLGVLLAIWRYSEAGHSRWLVACGAGLGLLTLTKPEPALAGVFAVVVWLLLRARRGSSLRREAPLVAVPAAFISVIVYAPLLATVGAHRLVLENLYPVGYLDAAGSIELHGRMPFTLESFVEVGSKLVLYSIGVAAILGAAYAFNRGGRIRSAVLVLVAIGAVLAIGGALAKPEALRHGLQFAYGWIPAAVGIALVLLLVSAFRRRGGWTPADQLSLAGVAALAVLALTNYPGFFPHGPHEQMSAYYIPLAAVFLVRLHLGELAPSRAAYVLGAMWLAFLAFAGTGLTLKDARLDSVAVRGPGGSLSDTAEEGPLYQAAVGWIERSTRPGDPIFVAPMMTNLYPLSQRWSPVDEISMLPGALPDAEEEERAIEALDRAGVRLVLTDDRAWPGYDHGAFGETFDKTLASWIRTHFERVATVTVPEHDSFEEIKQRRTLSVWTWRQG
jgi:4-amino-4-deoxy-L-arabinose transferase-like glycosyltransferase